MQKNEVYKTLETRPKTLDDIMIENNKATQTLVVIKAGTTVYPGETLVTNDGGKTFYPAYKEEYIFTKEDYLLGNEVVHEMYVYEARESNPPADSILDNTKWKNKGKFVVNGSLITTFPISATNEDEMVHVGVSVNCKLVSENMKNINDSVRVAGYPNICMI